MDSVRLGKLSDNDFQGCGNSLSRWERVRVRDLTRDKVLPQLSKKNIALTGFMAVGKSAVGQRLARKLGRPFVDLDKFIEANEGMKVREIFNLKGESHFRALEKEALGEVLRGDGQVIATGGGVVMDEENLRLLKERSLLVCLTASSIVLLRRSGRGNQRPLLQGGDRKKRMEALLREREKNYARAHAVVDTTSLSIDQVVDTIIDLVEKR